MTEEDDGHVHVLQDEDDEEVCDVPGVTAVPGSAPPAPRPRHSVSRTGSQSESDLGPGPVSQSRSILLIYS